MCCSVAIGFPVQQGIITDVAGPLSFGFTSKLGDLDNLAKVMTFNNMFHHFNPAVSCLFGLCCGCFFSTF